MTDLIFATMAGTSGAAQQALLWAKSIHSFGGRFANSPIWLLVPNHKERLPASLRVELGKSGVQLVSFEASEAELDFPFAGKTLAAGIAESLAEDHTSFLAWMDRDSLVLQEPTPLLLADGKVLGYRPVDHTLIGSLISESPSAFWSLIYNYCEVDEERITPMITSVDEETIRPYFNAGMLVVRPQQQLLRSWSKNFRDFYTLPAFNSFYDESFLCRLFMHQAVLAGTILAHTAEQDRQELPYLVNYPLHMHTDYPPPRRAARLNDLITCRYDTLADEAQWDQVITIEEPLQSWLNERRPASGML